MTFKSYTYSDRNKNASEDNAQNNILNSKKSTVLCNKCLTKSFHVYTDSIMERGQAGRSTLTHTYSDLSRQQQLLAEHIINTGLQGYSYACTVFSFHLLFFKDESYFADISKNIVLILIIKLFIIRNWRYTSLISCKYIF